MVSLLKRAWHYLENYAWVVVIAVVSIFAWLINRMVSGESDTKRFQSMLDKASSKARKAQDKLKIEKLKAKENAKFQQKKLDEIKSIDDDNERSKKLKSFLNNRL